MKKFITVFSLTAFLAAIAWFAAAKVDPPAPKPTTADVKLHLDTPEDDALPLNARDEAILEEALSLFNWQDSAGAAIYMAGVQELNNPTDSFQARHSIPFSYFKMDSTAFATGVQTWVNKAGCFALVDTAAQRIVVSPQKQIGLLQVMPLKALSKMLRKDAYVFERTSNNDTVTISITNEHHIACKEIKLKFLAGSKQPILFFSRFTNLDYITEAAYDQTTAVTIQQWVRSRKLLEGIPVPDLIAKKGDEVVAAAPYKGFELINLMQD